MSRKSRQGSKEHTVSVPPWVWWIMLLGGIAIGFYFGAEILRIIFTWLATVFNELAGLFGSALAVIAILIVLYILIRMRINISALLFGIIIGIVIGIIWVAMGFYTPVAPGETEVPGFMIGGLL